MEAAAISKVCQDPERAGQWSLQQQEVLEVPPPFMEIKDVGIPNDLDEQVLILCHAEAALIDIQVYPVVTISDAAPLRVHEIAIYNLNERYVSHEPRRGRGLRVVFIMGAFLAALGLGWFGGSTLHWLLDRRDELTGRAAVNAVVERIIGVESNGNPNAKNRRSSATGLGQFLNGTWLEMIRAHRPDLTKGRNESEILELRREANLAREITTRFAERNAAMLRRRGLPVTAGTVYLAHFAGGAGAVAVLSAPQNAEAALVMANADVTGRTKREQIIKANPFLESFSVADLKIWADRKMRDPGFHLADVIAAGIPTGCHLECGWNSVWRALR